MKAHDESDARSRQIREWWVEYKVAAQFSKTWDEVEEQATLANQRRGAESPPDDSRGQSRSTVNSASYWMQQVDVPRWFKRDELGIGTGHSIYDTLRTLPADNAERRRRHKKQVEQLRRSRKVLSRTRKW